MLNLDQFQLNIVGQKQILDTASNYQNEINHYLKQGGFIKVLQAQDEIKLQWENLFKDFSYYYV